MRASGFTSTLLALVVAALAMGSGASADRPKEKDGQRELHVVGVYEGYTKTGNEIHGGRVLVEVKRQGKLVTLVLGSYEPVTWHVTAAEGSKVEKVILCGYYRQGVKGLPVGVEVVEAFRKDQNPDAIYTTYKFDGAESRRMVQQVTKATGMDIASFHGAYRSRQEAPFVIDKVQSDARLSADYPKTTPLAELPKLSFKALLYASDPMRPHTVHVSHGDFTLEGPKVNSLRAVPRDIKRLAYDPEQKKHYGLSGHQVFEVDLENQQVKEMDLGLDVPRLSWPSGLTFDTKQQRLLLTAGGYLYAFSPKTKKWSVLAEKIACTCITYHAGHDCLYAIAEDFGEDSIPTLAQLNPNGAMLKKTRLPQPFFPGLLGRGPGGGCNQLVATDDHLVMLVFPDPMRGDGRGSPESFIFVIEPKKEKAWLSWKSQ